MQLCDIFLHLGEENFEQALRSVSMGTLRKAAPRVWTRLAERDDDVATDLSQAILVSHLDMIKAVLDHLGVPHEDGFFAKETDVSAHLKDGWQAEVWEKFRGAFPPAALLFYINHLAWEVAKAENVFRPAA